MVNIAGSYDENAEASDFDVVPAGKYRAKIIDSKVEDISGKNDYGRCLNLTWRIESGPHDGRLVWQRLNLWGRNMNNNEKVVQVANAQFADIRKATGILAPRDTEELHERACTITVTVKSDPNYPDKNEVKGVSAAEGLSRAPSDRSAPPPNGRAAPAANGAGGAPWPRRAPAENEAPF